MIPGIGPESFFRMGAYGDDAPVITAVATSRDKPSEEGRDPRVESLFKKQLETVVRRPSDEQCTILDGTHPDLSISYKPQKRFYTPAAVDGSDSIGVEFDLGTYRSEEPQTAFDTCSENSYRPGARPNDLGSSGSLAA